MKNPPQNQSMINRFAHVTLLPAAREIISLVRHYLYLSILQIVEPYDTVLEIGCGDKSSPAYMGPILLSIKSKTYLAIDKNPYPEAPFPFIQADIEETFPLGKYSKIILMGVISHIAGKPSLAEKIKSHLTPSGMTILYEGLTWDRSESQTIGTTSPHKIVDNFYNLFESYSNVDVFGVSEGIMVPDWAAKSGAICFAKK